MSKYAKYGKQLDELMRIKFANFEKAKDKYEKAKRNQELHPFIHGVVRQEQYVEMMRYKVAFEDAKKEYEIALKIFQLAYEEAQNIRKELYEEYVRDNKVDPIDLDRDVVEILDSGICTASEVVDLFYKAKNPTTKRYIASYAQKQYGKAKSQEDAALYNRIDYESKAILDPNLSAPLQCFDVALEVVYRTTKNTALIGYWGELTERALSEM